VENERSHPQDTPEEPKLTKNGVVQHAVEGDVVVLKGARRRRCAGTNRLGERCRAFALRDDDLCKSHAQLRDTGEVRFGNLTLSEAGQKSGRVRQARVHLRQTLVPSGRVTPRTALRALALRESGALAQRALDGALEGEASPAKGNLALRVIEVADPGIEAQVSFTVPQTMDDFNAMSSEQQKAWLLDGLE
jgi:hypothetical protein